MSDCEFCGFDNENNPLDNGRYCNDECELGHAYEQLSKLEAELAAANKRIENLWAALGVLLDSVDYTSGACKLNEAVGAVLPIEIIEKAKAALKASND